MSKAGEAVYEGVLSRGNVSPRAMESMVNVVLLGKTRDEDSTTDSSSDEKSDVKSKQLSGDPFSMMAKGEFVPPRHNPQVWAATMEQSTRLGRCIRTYARNTVGLGWFIEPVQKVGPETPKELRKKVEEQTMKLQRLFDRPNDLMPTTQLFFMMKMDEEAIGNGYLEIVRDNAGKIAKIFHVPGVSMRVRVREGADGEQLIGGFVQVRGNEKRYFKEFGDKNVMTFDKGEYYKGKKPLSARQRATEILHFKLYSPTSTWYGSPRYLSAAPAISGNRLAALRNVNFFENDAPQPIDTPVLTPSGWRTMGDLVPGDKVIGSDGKPHTILGVYEQGIQPVYRVKFMGDASTECTLDHVWTVSNQYDRQCGVMRKMTLQQLLDDGLHYEGGTAKWAVPLSQPVEYAPSEKPLPVDPYLMGLLLGDGSFRVGDKGSITLASSSEDIEVMETVLADVAPEGTEVALRRRSGHGFPGSRAGHGEFRFPNVDRKQGSVYPNPLKKAVRELGLLNVRGEDKFIPSSYLKASIDERVYLLQGLIDADGCVSDTTVRYVTNSVQLAHDVQTLVGSLGGMATVRKVKSRSTYQVTISKKLPDWIVPARLPRKVENYNKRRVLQRVRTLLGAEFSRNVETRCIKVDVSDSLYVTEDFIVTHNTPRMAVLVSGGTLTPESVQSIEDFFKAKVQGVSKAHSVCVIQAEQRQVGFQQQGRGPRLDLKPLTVGVTEDASFETYRKSNDEEIREAFGLAPVFFTTESVNKACVSGSTVVLLADGSKKTIKELVDEYGDDGEFPVYGFCKSGGEVGVAKGRAPRVTKTAKVFEVVAEGDEIILEATDDHEVLLENEAYAFVRDLLPGDLLMRYSVTDGEVGRCEPYKVKCVRFTGRTEEVYDLTSDVYHNFLVGSGMVVHNSSQVCVTGDTRIPLLDSNCLTIQELAEKYKDDPEACFPVFSVDEEGNTVVGWGYHPRKTKKARVFDVVLDNGMAIRATSDHPFMLRNGEYREVKDLTPGLSLMPWYVRMPFNQNMSPNAPSYGYWDVYNPATDKYEMMHNMVARSRGDDLSGDVIVHHEDGDPLNNHPENLSTVDRIWHCRHHKSGIAQFSGDDHSRYKDISFERVCQEASSCAGRNDLLKALGIGTSALTRILTENGYSYDTFSKKFMLPRGRPPKGLRHSRFRKDATFESLVRVASSCFYRRDLVRATGYSQNLIYRLLREEGYSYGDFRKKFMASSRKEAVESKINHRVVAVRYAGEEDVYDISVHDFHNFATASGVVISNSREITNEQELEPDRLEKEYIINQTIVPDVLGEEPLVRFRFERMKLTDPLDTARMDQTYAGLGALTPNELRSSIGKPPYPKDYKFADKPMQIATAEMSMQLAEAIIGEFKTQIEHQTKQAQAQQQASGMGGMVGGAPEGEMPEGEEEAPEGEEIEGWSDDASTDESSPLSDESTEVDSDVRRVHEALGLGKNGFSAAKAQSVQTLLGMATDMMSEARRASIPTGLPVSLKEE